MCFICDENRRFCQVYTQRTVEDEGDQPTEAREIMCWNEFVCVSLSLLLFSLFSSVSGMKIVSGKCWWIWGKH